MTPERAASPDIAPSVMDTVEEHVGSDVSREVGGVLVGVIEDGKAHIEAALPALRAVGGKANVTFTHEVWDDVLATVDRGYPDSKIVGWYHSHPGFGIFLSEYDRFIQKNFFSSPEMLALVVDPLAGQFGWFGWRNESIELLGEVKATTAAPKVTPEAQAATRSRGRAAAILVASLLAVAGLALGYWLGSSSAPAVSKGPNTAAVAQLQQQLQVPSSRCSRWKPAWPRHRRSPRRPARRPRAGSRSSTRCERATASGRWPRSSTGPVLTRVGSWTPIRSCVCRRCSRPGSD